jgi:hypothetical protein
VWGRRHLQEGYELGRSQATHMMALTKSEHDRPQLVLQRLGTLERSRIRWLLDADFGSVR